MSKKTFEVLSQTEHVLRRPGMYVGSTEVTPAEHFVMTQERFEKKAVLVSPALYKLFDEAIVNAYDQSVEDSTLKTIKVDVTDDTLTFYNDGVGIPIEKHESGLYIPHVIFGKMLSGSNFDDSKKRFTGGQNGLGIKLCNLFSSSMNVQVSDGTSLYEQTFSDNMSKHTEPKIKKKKGKAFVKISFQPDLKRFGLSSIDDQHKEVFQRRTYDICSITKASVSVYYNGEKLKIKDFSKYSNMFGITPLASFQSNMWEVIVGKSPTSFSHLSFVNGICTSVGGTHVDYLSYKISSEVVAMFDKRNKKFAGSLKPSSVKDKLFLMVKSNIDSPTFTSQTKEQLATPAKMYVSSIPMIDEKFITKVYKGVCDDLMTEVEVKEKRKLSKTDGTKKSKVVIDKLDDARWAGTSKSSKCTLIVTEGDSARTFAIAGLGSQDRSYYGVFPLRGKLLNVRDASVTQINNNSEISNLKQILGLKTDKKYTNVNELRYGKLMILTDQDLDGFHIKGLVMNFIDHYWPELFHLGFTCSMFTPVIKATKGSQIIPFYSMPDFEHANKQGKLKGFKIKYYKGLGTSSSKEAKEYFSSMRQHTIEFSPDTKTPEVLSMAFKKSRADDRKEWILQNTGRNDFGVNHKNITNFVNDELVQFSIYDNIRSIPNVMDGLKPSQRKILHTVLNNANSGEVKVAQLAPKVAESSHYHHGEQSLVGAIVSMAQDFIGSNQMNLLLPNGQFGSRIQGGKDCASARYIFTQLSPITPKLFRKEDAPLLNYEYSDGHKVEPTYFAPVLPMVLVNGASGIGTGFSTSVPTYRKEDIVTCIRSALEDKELPALHPYYEGFQGKIVECGQGKYDVWGSWSRNGSKVTITELPIGVWTDQLKESLDKHEYDYINESSEVNVRFEIKTDDPDDVLLKKLPLKKSLNTNNMYLFDPSGKIKKYQSAHEIVREFVKVRKELFEKRRLHLLEEIGERLEELNEKIRFIELVIKGSIEVFRKKKSDIEEQLRRFKFKLLDGTYEKYLSIPLYAFTSEKISALQSEIKDKLCEQTSYQSTTATDMWTSDISMLSM